MEGSAKDFVEHLRLVHFSIMLVSATVVITTLDSENQDTRRDLMTIEGIIDQQKPLADIYRNLRIGALERLVRAAVVPKGTVPTTHAGTLTLHSVHANVTATVELFAPLGIVFHGDSSYGWSPDHAEQLSYSDLFAGLPAQQEPISPPVPDMREWGRAISLSMGSGVWTNYDNVSESMNEFRGMWNSLAMMRHGYILDNLQFMNAYQVLEVEIPGSIPIRHIDSFLRNSPSLPERCKFLIPVDRTWAQVSKGDYFSLHVTILPITVDDSWHSVGSSDTFVRKLVGAGRVENDNLEQVLLENLAPGDIIVAGSASYKHVPINLQRQLLSAVEDKNHTPGAFDYSFPALSAYIENINYGGDININLVDALVAQDSVNSSAPIEIAGLKLSRATIGFWGLVLLASFQLYFALHLRELIRRALTSDERLTAAWIAVYPGAWNALVTIFSLLALPLFALILAIRTLPHFSAFSTLVMMLSGLLNIIIGVSIRTIRATKH